MMTPCNGVDGDKMEKWNGYRVQVGAWTTAIVTAGEAWTVSHPAIALSPAEARDVAAALVKAAEKADREVVLRAQLDALLAEPAPTAAAGKDGHNE